MNNLWRILSAFLCATVTNSMPPSRPNVNSLKNSLKSNFSSSIADSLLGYSAFRMKFDVPYIDVVTALTYSREIGRATAFNSILNDHQGVDEFVTQRLLAKLLPGRGSCRDMQCAATSIGEILAELLISEGFDLTKMPANVLRMYAGNLSGNILWRLSRIPNLDEKFTKKDEKTEFIQLVDYLSKGISDSSYISEFYKTRNADSSTFRIMSSSVCGSRAMDFKNSVTERLSDKMTETHERSKAILGKQTSYLSDYQLASGVFSEAIVFDMMKQGSPEFQNGVNKTADDILKFVMLGITNSKMNLGLVNSWAKSV